LIYINIILQGISRPSCRNCVAFTYLLIALSQFVLKFASVSSYAHTHTYTIIDAIYISSNE